MEAKIRVKELLFLPAGELKPNPKNWREHPEFQRKGLESVLREIGYAGAIIARRLDDGTFEIIDGHLRSETTPNQKVPVLVVDLTAEEADKVLATHDPLGAMAEVDQDILEGLLKSLKTDDESFSALLDSIASKNGITPPSFPVADGSEQSSLDHPNPVICPKCGHEFEL